MFKSVAEYAEQLLDANDRSVTRALSMLHLAREQYPNVPSRFWSDVAAEIGEQQFWY